MFKCINNLLSNYNYINATDICDVIDNITGIQVEDVVDKIEVRTSGSFKGKGIYVYEPHDKKAFLIKDEEGCTVLIWVKDCSPSIPTFEKEAGHV